MGYPWISLHSWQPFSIDALGLVTLLGSEEINACIGRLVSSRWLEYMPLLAGFVIAGDRFRAKNPSFHLYNISSGINTTDLSFWFTRWMLAQEFEVTRSVVYWEIDEKPGVWWHYHLIPFTVSFCLTGFLVVMTVLSKDWYGFANASAIIVSIIVRAHIMQANRDAINRAVKKARPPPGTYQHALQQWQGRAHAGPAGSRPAENARPDGTHWKNERAKIMVIMSDSKAVTMFIPEQLVVPVFVRDPEPRIGWLYHVFRYIGWVAFAVHIVALGTSKLASQMYTVALLVIPTVLTCWKFGCNDSKWYCKWMKFLGKDMSPQYSCWIGSRLKAKVFEWPKDTEFKRENDGVWRRKLPVEITSRNQRSERRQDLYAWLNLTAEEEDSLSKWDLLPHTRNNDNTWSRDYNAKKALIRNAQMNIAAAYTDNPLDPQGPQRTNTRLTASGMTT